MDTVIFIGQIFGIGLSVLAFLTYVQKSRGKILITKMILDFLSIFQQAMVGAFTGSALNGIAVFRETVFYFRDTKRWAQSKLWLIVFLVAMCVAPLLTWQGLVSLLPSIGSSFAVVGFYCRQRWLMRVLGIVSQALWLIYACIILNVGTILGSSFCILGACIGLIRDARTKKKNKKENIGEEK